MIAKFPTLTALGSSFDAGGPVHVRLAKFYPDFIQILSRQKLDIIEWKKPLYPNFIKILSKTHYQDKNKVKLR